MSGWSSCSKILRSVASALEVLHSVSEIAFRHEDLRELSPGRGADELAIVPEYLLLDRERVLQGRSRII